MRIVRFGCGLILILILVNAVGLHAETKPRKMTVVGKLGHVMAIGGETTGWVIQTDSPITVDGKQVSSIEVDAHEPVKLQEWDNKHLTARGELTHRQGVETGNRPVLMISSIREVKAAAHQAQSAPFTLAGSEWALEDLAGTGVIDLIAATLTFPEDGKVAGNGSCNRFFGPAEIQGQVIKLGPLGATRMACPEALMNQETKYLNALQAAERFEWKNGKLLIYCKGFDKPLRFTATSSATLEPKPVGQ